VQFNIFKDTIMVVNPIPGGPSERLGIMAGDRIVTVDGENVAGIGVTNDDVMKKLKGPKGTRVVVGILRDGEPDILEFEIIRDVIPIFSVDAAFMVAPKIGYIKVNRFAKTTMGELHAALDTLRTLGMKDLVLDLQGNGGGMLRTATEMADEFLGGDKLLVYTEGRAFPREDTFAALDGSFEKGRLVVLIDQGSASASEIVADDFELEDVRLAVAQDAHHDPRAFRALQLLHDIVVRDPDARYVFPVYRHDAVAGHDA
jgi:carboxyl-terminal processing protease